ncbi:1,4-dihydroxy-2-naphthoate polyprenyltransferase [Puniceicoccaceae bacterium K14]|nr:1,4-dihydroxy-2-naphthoate polyprenyltransferase [Puniceicoccaceae bacterium K14]
MARSEKSNLVNWLAATRPKTLVAAVVPIVVGAAEAHRVGFFDWYPVVICLSFALLVQIATNMANDYFDFIKGADTEDRLGPDRMVAKGNISPRAMIVVAVSLFALAFFIGLGLIQYRGWELLVVGIVSILFGYCYTGGPYPLAYNGLGDVFVIFFFGVVATAGTYYVIVGQLSIHVFLLGGSLGLLANNILVANNCRDRETDAKADKRTLIVVCGRQFGTYQFGAQLLGAIGFIVIYAVMSQNAWAFLPFASGILGWKSYRFIAANDGSSLNQLLEMAAKTLVLFGLLAAIGIALGS